MKRTVTPSPTLAIVRNDHVHLDGSGVNREARTKPLSSSARHPKAVVAKAVALPVVSFSGGPLG